MTSYLCKTGLHENQCGTGNEGGDVQSDSNAWEVPTSKFITNNDINIHIYVFFDDSYIFFLTSYYVLNS